MARRQQTRRRGVAGIGDDSTSTPTRRRSSQTRQATGDPTHQSRRLDSTRRGSDVVAIVAALVLLIILLNEFGFWRLLWVVFLGFWRLLWAVFLDFCRLLWAMVLLFFWLLELALRCSWLLDWVALPAMTILGLIVLGAFVVDWVRDRSEVAPPYPSNDMPVGDNAPTTTGRGGDEATDSAILTEELANLPKKFSYKELSKATNSFASRLKLGEGGFGIVYKGHIGEGEARTPVAVKKITSGARQGKNEYKAEVKSLSQLGHINLVQLIGYCHESNKFALVYEFIEGHNLDYHLFKCGHLLTWDRRYNIALGLASALHYLHKEFRLRQCVIHRDIKSSNVMLDKNFVAKLGDFGLAKLVNHARGLITTQLTGTPGYWAPEYVRMGKISKKSDIYSFGVVLLEILCGRRVSDLELAEQGGLVRWVWKRSGCGSWCGRWFWNFRLPVDERLGKDFDKKQAEALMIVGLWCAHPIASSRLSTKKAMAVLNLTEKPPKLPSKIPSFNI